jgi:gas vesicle protein
MKDSTKTLLGFAAGVAVGAAALSLAKTEKGQKAIKGVSKKLDVIGEDVKHMVEKGKHAAEDLAKKFNGKLSSKEAEIVS